MNRYLLWFVGAGTASAICGLATGYLLRNLSDRYPEVPPPRPSRRARDERHSPASDSARPTGPSSEGATIFDWASLERHDRDHRFLHVSLRAGNTKVAVCSCTRESRRFANSELAVEDWQVHSAFESMVAGMR